MNDVKLSGRLVRDPELKHTQNGVPVATVEVKTDFKQGLTGSKKNLSDNGNPLKFLDVNNYYHQVLHSKF